MYVYVHMYFDPSCAEGEGNVKKNSFYAGRAGVSHAAIHNTGLGFANLVGLSQPARFAKPKSHTYRVGLSQRLVHYSWWIL